MNWVLLLVFYISAGSTTEQVGLYATSADCERAYEVAKDGLIQVDWARHTHVCVPVGLSLGSSQNPGDFPEEFD